MIADELNPIRIKIYSEGSYIVDKPDVNNSFEISREFYFDGKNKTLATIKFNFSFVWQPIEMCNNTGVRKSIFASIQSLVRQPMQLYERAVRQHLT